jgi:hypothetical protein
MLIKPFLFRKEMYIYPSSLLDHVKKLRAVLRDLLIFALAVLFVIIFWRNNFLVAFLLLLVYLLRSFFGYQKDDHVIFVVGALLGSSAEIIATSRGIWTYTNPTFLNIPIWLPFAWGIGAVLIIRIAQTLTKK